VQVAGAALGGGAALVLMSYLKKLAPHQTCIMIERKKRP